MRKFLSYGFIAAFAMLAITPKVGAEPPPRTAMIGSITHTSESLHIQQLMAENPAIANKMQMVIEKNPALVLSVARKVLTRNSPLVKQIENNPQLLHSMIAQHPQLMQALLSNPQLLDRFQQSISTTGK